MLNVPPAILRGFGAILEQRAVPSAQHNFYRKWLRYFLDFCDKYRLEPTSSKSAVQFQTKLREKKQTERQIRQAVHAVSLYFDLMQLSKPASTSLGAQALATAAEAAAPYSLPPPVPSVQPRAVLKSAQASTLAQIMGSGGRGVGSHHKDKALLAQDPQVLLSLGAKIARIQERKRTFFADL